MLQAATAGHWLVVVTLCNTVSSHLARLQATSLPSRVTRKQAVQGTMWPGVAAATCRTCASGRTLPRTDEGYGGLGKVCTLWRFGVPVAVGGVVLDGEPPKKKPLQRRLTGYVDARTLRGASQHGQHAFHRERKSESLG